MQHPMITRIVASETENQDLLQWLASSWHTHKFTNKKCISMKRGKSQK